MKSIYVQKFFSSGLVKGIISFYIADARQIHLHLNFEERRPTQGDDMDSSHAQGAIMRQY